MKAEELKYFRGLLTDWREQLLRQADGAIGGLLPLSAHPIEFMDRASFQSELTFALRIKSRESKLIQKIQAAIGRIDARTYGICETCGKEIDRAQLRVHPVTTRCSACKKKSDAPERRIGL